MGWRAITGQRSVDVGTVLFVYLNGQMLEDSEPRLIGEQAIDIQTSEGWISGSIESIKSDTAILSLSANVRYQMTQRRDDERGAGITIGGQMYGRDWIVRSRIIPGADSR